MDNGSKLSICPIIEEYKVQNILLMEREGVTVPRFQGSFEATRRSRAEVNDNTLIANKLNSAQQNPKDRRTIFVDPLLRPGVGGSVLNEAHRNYLVSQGDEWNDS